MTVREIVPISEALVALQSELKTIPHNRNVEVKMKAGGKYTYRYTTFDAMLDEIRPLLVKHGFSLTNSTSVDGGSLFLQVVLEYKDGAQRTTTLPVPVTADPRGLGANLSYMRRYGAACLLGLAFEEEDTDGGSGEEAAATPPSRSSRKPPPGDTDKATRNAKHLWARTNEAAAAMGLTKPEGEALLRSLIVETCGDEKSTKLLSDDERTAILAKLVEKIQANAPPGESK